MIGLENLKQLLPLILLSSFMPLATASEAQVQIENGWVRLAPPNVKVLAAYMTIQNTSDESIQLIGAQSPSFQSVMFHQTAFDKGMAKMRHTERLTIPAQSSITLKPGGLHLMLMGRNTPLAEDDHIEICLIFAKQAHQIITLPVKKISAEIGRQ